MKRKTVVVTFLILAVSILLAACGAPQSNTEEPDAGSSAPSDLTRIDEQGTVEVEVRPVNLSNPGQTLEFEVTMNTHSVDLSMDLATLATLSTDTGKTATALKWDAPRGGHHVSGTLSFPANANGSALLDGAKRLTLVIKDVATPERTFVWDLSS